MMALTLFQSGSVFLTKAVSHEVFRCKCRCFWGAAEGWVLQLFVFSFCQEVEGGWGCCK